MKYNLLGQKGIEGTINQDAPEAGPYIYDTPPGKGKNKGVKEIKSGKETIIVPVNKTQHERNVKEADEKTYLIGSAVVKGTIKPIKKEEEDLGIDSGPLKPGEAGYGIDTWWKFLGFESIDEAITAEARGEISSAQITRAKDEVEEKRDVGRTEYPKTLINKQGDSTTIKSKFEESWARQAGYDKEPKDLTLSQGINLLRKYEQGKIFLYLKKKKQK